jgi:hypothetical protein
MFGVPYRASATRTIAGVRTRTFSPTTTPLLAGAAGYALIRHRSTEISPRDARLLVFFALAAVLVVLTYARSLPGMPASPGIIPDMRYLSPAYLPMLIIGVYTFKHAGMDADGVRESLKTLFWLAVIDLPLIFVGRPLTFSRGSLLLSVDLQHMPVTLEGILLAHQAFPKCDHLKVRLNSSPSIPACLRMPFRVPLFNSRCRGTEKTRHPFCTTTWDEVCRCGTKPCRARYFTISSPETTGSLCDISYVNLRYLVTYS